MEDSPQVSFESKEAEGFEQGDEEELEEIEEEKMGEIRMLVNQKHVGAIIGRSGSTIHDIRKESCCVIRISNHIHGVTERTISIQGIAQHIALACYLIASKLLEIESRDNSDVAVLNLLIPHSQIGSIIGKDGTHISDIRAISGAHINIAAEQLPNSTDRRVVVCGTPEAIDSGIMQIAETLINNPFRGKSVPYQPQPKATYRPEGAYGVHSLQGNSYRIMGASQPHSPHSLGLGGLGGLGLGGLGALSSVPMQPIRTQIQIPNILAGCIIGKGGSSIREIRQLSRAHIQISDPDVNDNRVVSLIGTIDSIQVAQYLINLKLAEEYTKQTAMNSSFDNYGQ